VSAAVLIWIAGPRCRVLSHQLLGPDLQFRRHIVAGLGLFRWARTPRAVPQSGGGRTKPLLLSNNWSGYGNKRGGLIPSYKGPHGSVPLGVPINPIPASPESRSLLDTWIGSAARMATRRLIQTGTMQVAVPNGEAGIFFAWYEILPGHRKSPSIPSSIRVKAGRTRSPRQIRCTGRACGSLRHCRLGFLTVN